MSPLFYLFVSHWKSRAFCHKNHPDRHSLGISLRHKVDEIHKNFGDESHLILLGDYNDEPFDESLSEQLMATRDKALIFKKKKLLYNPFWHYLSYDRSKLEYAGTYYYKDGQTTKWHTFDQIIVSSAFIVGKEWLLNEQATGIVHFPEYLQLVKERKTIFDHLPVITTIEKVCDD